MSPPPQQIRIGEVLDQGWAHMRDNARACLPWTLSVSLLSFAVSAGLLVGLGQLLSRALGGPGGPEQWRVVVIVVLGGLALFAVQLATALLVGAGLMPAAQLRGQGGALSTQDVLRLGLRAAPRVARLWAVALSLQLAVFLLLLAPLGGALGALSGEDQMSWAISGVLLALAAVLVLALSATVGVARYALAWPIVVLEVSSVRQALLQSSRRLRGHARLTLGLGAIFVGLTFALGLALSLWVPQPEIVNLSARALLDEIPKLVQAQLLMQIGGTGAVGLVGLYASACVYALGQLTAGE